MLRLRRFEGTTAAAQYITTHIDANPSTASAYGATPSPTNSYGSSDMFGVGSFAKRKYGLHVPRPNDKKIKK